MGRASEHTTEEGTPEAGSEEHVEEHAEGVEVDVSGLKVEVAYGGETKTVTIQPAGDGLPGQYLAPILPTRPGQYTIRFSGALGETAVHLEVQPEEVEATDFIQFPASVSQADTGLQDAVALTRTLAIWGLVVGALGLALGAGSYWRRK